MERAFERAAAAAADWVEHGIEHALLLGNQNRE